VVIVPILANASARPKVLEACNELENAIQEIGKGSKLPYSVGVMTDRDETKQPGWKFHEYELLGIPLRIEIGPRDLEKKQVVMTRRDIGQKEFVAISEVPSRVLSMLADMQSDLLRKAREHREAHTFTVKTYGEMKEKLEAPGGFILAPWCQSKECESKVKEETKATIRCLPLDDQFQPIPEMGKCAVCEGSGSTVRAVFAKSY
jgi:prolyl-tRNA synthetase